jgi:hypothetical protein
VQCFLCGTDWILKYYLDELRLHKVVKNTEHSRRVHVVFRAAAQCLSWKNTKFRERTQTVKNSCDTIRRSSISAGRCNQTALWWRHTDSPCFADSCCFVTPSATVASPIAIMAEPILCWEGILSYRLFWWSAYVVIRKSPWLRMALFFATKYSHFWFYAKRRRSYRFITRLSSQK